MLISDNSPARKNYFDSNIIQNENARLLPCFQMDYFKAGVARSQKCLHPTSSRREMCTSSVSTCNVIYHKFSNGACFYTLNEENINVMLEYWLIDQGVKAFTGTSQDDHNCLPWT